MRFALHDHKAPVIFEEMGFRYVGPIDGHDYDTLTDVISNARKIDGPVLLHVKHGQGQGLRHRGGRQPHVSRRRSGRLSPGRR